MDASLPKTENYEPTFNFCRNSSNNFSVDTGMIFFLHGNIIKKFWRVVLSVTWKCYYAYGCTPSGSLDYSESPISTVKLPRYRIIGLSTQTFLVVNTYSPDVTEKTNVH